MIEPNKLSGHILSNPVNYGDDTIMEPNNLSGHISSHPLNLGDDTMIEPNKLSGQISSHHQILEIIPCWNPTNAVVIYQVIP